MRGYFGALCLGMTAACSAGAVTPYTPGQTTTAGIATTPSNSSNPNSAPTPVNPTATNPNTADSNTTTPPPIFNCDTTKYPVCDGFELASAGGPPDGNRWDFNVTLPSPGDPAVHSDSPQEDSIKVSTKFAHTGKQSLWFHTVGGWEHIPIEAITSTQFPNAFLPAPNNVFYVRYWVYHDATTFDPTGGHWYMVNASGPLDGRQQYEKMGGGGTNFGWNYYGPDSGIGSATAWPLGTWNCVETEFKGDTQELFVWLNDQELTDMHSAAGNWAAPAYDRLTIGWEMDHPNASYLGADVYVDDLVYSYSRIGCK